MHTNTIVCAGRTALAAGVLTACSGSASVSQPIGRTAQAADLAPDSTEAISTQAPAIDWASIGQIAPRPIDLGERSASDPLPSADIVILTWTSAEWSAMDHVFVNSGAPRSPSDDSWRSAWSSYTHNASSFSGGDSGGELWGSFQMVQIADANGAPWNVILFKSNAHLAHEPWIAGLRAMVENILADAAPRLIYSIGTAGAAQRDQQLGDAVVTNAAFLQATLPHNASDPANGQTFTSAFYPTLDLEAEAEKLMFPLGDAATAKDLDGLVESVLGSSSVSAGDLIDGALTNLTAPTVHPLPGVPLNTSDDFGMAPGNGVDPYSVYEEDDAVVAEAAGLANVGYAFIRNVSDTVVPDTTTSGGAISLSVRQSWSSALYDRYGFLTAVNGAIAAWGTIAGNTQTLIAPAPAPADAGAPATGG